MANPPKNYFSLGDASNRVAACQHALNLAQIAFPAMQELGPLPISGNFDDQTARLTELFQSIRELKPDGKLGPITAGELFIKASMIQKLTITVPENFKLTPPSLFPPPSLGNALGVAHTIDLIGRKTQITQWSELNKKLTLPLFSLPNVLNGNALNLDALRSFDNPHITAATAGKTVFDLLGLKSNITLFSLNFGRKVEYTFKAPVAMMPKFFGPLIAAPVLDASAHGFDVTRTIAIKREGSIDLAGLIKIKGDAHFTGVLHSSFVNNLLTAEGTARAGATGKLSITKLEQALGVQEISVSVSGDLAGAAHASFNPVDMSGRIGAGIALSGTGLLNIGF